jgi:uncharacterized protein YycO
VRPGDVALVRPNGWLGEVISVDTRSPYCHARMITASDGSTVEANPPGAYRGKVQPGDVIVTAPLTDEQRAQIAEVAEKLVGTPYGFLDVGALGLAQFGLRLPFLEARLGRTDRLFCSQLVDLVWQRVGFRAFTPETDPDFQRTGKERLPQDVTPGDLADLAFCSSWHAEVLR